MFKNYRQAWLEMESDVRVQSVREDIEANQRELAMLESPYRNKMALAAKVITGLVIEHGEDITRSGITAKLRLGRVTTSWKKVAQEVGAPLEVIDQFTKVGAPSVSIKIQEFKL